MQYVICYDIADDYRRNRVAEALKDFGTRIQESVFAAHLDEELAGKLRERIVKLIEPHLDAVHVFMVCSACARRTETYGVGHMPPEQDYYIV